MRLDELVTGVRVDGLADDGLAVVVAVERLGAGVLKVVFEDRTGKADSRLVYQQDAEAMSLAALKGRPFDASADDFRLAAEAQRIRLAGLHDPMVAVSTSDVRPLPHQIRAVYGEMLTRTPLRFLLADDPGAGKTIMAGLYIKELLLRDDVRRCLIVAPGGLVEQWRDELKEKFNLDFAIFDPKSIDATSDDPFAGQQCLIARMDQLARNDELLTLLGQATWDLVVVDEAHRMTARYFSSKLEKSRRYELGELLSRRARHLLLMTATPHSGKPDEFQLFLRLLDADAFEGKHHEAFARTDVSPFMRRMIKEDLLTFEGRPLFPERRAHTVPYHLTSQEMALYDDVSNYVRTGMNRAQRLDGKRRNTVGFAMTVLQRRLASSPEAIYQSLRRRRDRLVKAHDELARGVLAEPKYDLLDVDDLDDLDEFGGAELEQIEGELVDAATASRTAAELDAELRDLDALIDGAKRVRASGDDRKWQELRRILDEEVLRYADGTARKLIIFTEHRDTLEYLRDRISTQLGRPDAVVAIHGAVSRRERRDITHDFSTNPDRQVLLATDAAGEGLNLQAAHLMVNYDLPWNPNRIEQRFGRVHRIGQEEVCQLWNLVADGTREGEVLVRLLLKIEEQRKAYGGKVFDVLGDAFHERSLRDLLIDAIRYGDDPAHREKMNEVIDAAAGDGLVELLREQALASDSMTTGQIESMRSEIDAARARRLQPHYIQNTFTDGFRRLGGRLSSREHDRFEIRHVPAALRQGRSGSIPAQRYERVAFALENLAVDESPIRAELVAPGHPLHDAVNAATLTKWGDALDRGAVLAWPGTTEPLVLVALRQSVSDATGEPIDTRFDYCFVNAEGAVSPAGIAPYLDMVEIADSHRVPGLVASSWVSEAEQRAVGWAIEHAVPDYLDRIRVLRGQQIQHVRSLVSTRLTAEINRLSVEGLAARQAEADGRPRKRSSETLARQAEELAARLEARNRVLDKQLRVVASSPQVVYAALVVPHSWADDDGEKIPLWAHETAETDRRAITAVLRAERSLGRSPVEQPHNNPGFDIYSTSPDGSGVTIEVKGRIAGAEQFWVTRTEVLTAKNLGDDYRLALVSVSPDGEEHDEIRYVANPFRRYDFGDFAAAGTVGEWKKSWVAGTDPF